MFGLVFAGLCAAGLYRIWRPRRFGHCGMGPHGGRGGWRRIDRLVRYLDANPQQEAAIRQSAEEVRQAFRNFNPRARLDVLSAALTAETFDREQLRSQLNEPAMSAISEAILNAVERLRAALDMNQRRKMAALVPSGGWGCR